MQMTPLVFEGRLPVQGYGNGGFRFQGSFHQGSVIALPTGVISWPVQSLNTADAESLEPLIAARDEIDFVLFGTGDEHLFLPPPLREALDAVGLMADPMATGPACRTYNVLLAEDRRVAAAFIAVAGKGQ
ncbi:MAG: Mth938-like domain-containing protein [Pseudomonadota bacterium]